MTSVISASVDRDARRRWTATHLDQEIPPAPHPAPEVTARPARADDPVPGAVADLAAAAERAGWDVLVTYARGTRMYADGSPGSVIDSVAVRMWRFPIERAVAVYENGSADTGWHWRVGELPRSIGVDAVKRVVTDRPPKVKTETAKRWCMHCAKDVAVNANGSLRVHGPKDNRCVGK